MALLVILRWALLGPFEATHLGVISAERTFSHDADDWTGGKHIRSLPSSWKRPLVTDSSGDNSEG